MSRYCDCGSDGLEVLDCWQCGRTRCEDCASGAEVLDQCCRECGRGETTVVPVAEVFRTAWGTVEVSGS
jgi:hypothetical protein